LQAYNYVGTGNVQGTAVVPADPSLTDQNTNRDEKSLELSVQDAIRWNDQPSPPGWACASTRWNRDSIRTDGIAGHQLQRQPHHALAGRQLQCWLPTPNLYASYGEGVESQVVPNRAAQYTNAGVACPR
jgi:iron complex outermembrane receptor protein